MTSEQKSKDTESSLTLGQRYLMDCKLARLSCPFTWKMGNVTKYRNNLLASENNRFETITDLKEQFPEFVLVWHLMFAYEKTLINELEGAMQAIGKAEQSLADIKQQATLETGERVLQYIFMATKCHVLRKQGKLSEVDELFEQIDKINCTEISQTESAILNGCQCLAWSLYDAKESKETNFAEKAIECEPRNGKWHYLLGKSYRSYRKKYQPERGIFSEKEELAFKKAYELFKNTLFGASLARFHRESSNYGEANRIHKEIYDLKPTCCTVRLQLALGFIRAKEYELAKDCLDYVAERRPNSPTYAHYMGIYEEERNDDPKAALLHYQTTVNKKNYAAERQYLECRLKVEPNWDPLPHLLDVLERCERDADLISQQVNVMIGTYYLVKKNDILSACVCLKKAIEIRPDAPILKSHQFFFSPCSAVNIYEILEKNIKRTLKRRTMNHNSDAVDLLMYTRALCSGSDI